MKAIKQIDQYYLFNTQTHADELALVGLEVYKLKKLNINNHNIINDGHKCVTFLFPSTSVCVNLICF